MTKYISIENQLFEAELIIELNKINDEILPPNRKMGKGSDKNQFYVNLEFYTTFSNYFPLILNDRLKKNTGTNTSKIKNYLSVTSMLNSLDFINQEIRENYPKENAINESHYFTLIQSILKAQSSNTTFYIESEIANAQNGIGFKNWDNRFKEIIKNILLPTTQLKVYLFKKGNIVSAFWDFKQEYIHHSNLNLQAYLPPTQHQIIFYGSPGTGKSREVEYRTKNQNRTRTTFHPETDYHSFVGSYKPVMEGKNIKYEFVPQAFTNAYCNAWLNPTQPYFLIIEEINRGNCAQIFGDIFQCLDRDENGQSKYDINCDKDLALYLKETFTNTANKEAVENYKNCVKTEDFGKLLLPANLYIYATMNTSDHSLFPIDSAFKRRWDWEFIPINYTDATSLTIIIDENTSYNWGTFIATINPKIKELTGSEDKQLGNRFLNPTNGNISFEQLRSKVLFYLWTEVYKDEVGTQTSIFKYNVLDNEPKDFQFGDLFAYTVDDKNPIELVKAFMLFNGVVND